MQAFDRHHAEHAFAAGDNTIAARYRGLTPERLAARLAEDVIGLTPEQIVELARIVSDRGWVPE